MTQRKTKPQKSSVAPFIGFINFTPTEAEKEAFKAIDWNPEIAFAELESLVDDEISVKFGWDGYNKCYQATLGRIDQSHPDAGVFISGRGKDLSKALKQAIYVHKVIAEGEWLDTYKAQRNVFIED